MGKGTLRESADPLFLLLRESRIDEFNRRRQDGARFDFTSCNFRGMDLRGADVHGIDFSDCYFRQSDLRGLDLRSCRLEGASLHGAHISGTYFPVELAADEIDLSVRVGTRLRYRPR